MRAYVDKIRNPRTSLQMDNRLRFKTLSQLASAFMSATGIGMERVANSLRNTVCNSFMKVNQSAVSVRGGEAEVDYGSLTCSLGGMFSTSGAYMPDKTPTKVCCRHLWRVPKALSTCACPSAGPA